MPRAPLPPLDATARELAAAHHGLAVAMARRLAKHCGTPEEILCGAAHEGLCEAAGRFVPSRGVPFPPYAARVIYHRMWRQVTVWRRGGRLDFTRFTDLDTPPEEDGTRFDPADDRPFRADLAARRAVTLDLLDVIRRILPPRWWQIVAWTYRDGLNGQTVAAHLGCSRQAVTQTIRRARAWLRHHAPHLEDLLA